MAVVAQNYATFPDQNMAPAYRNDPAPSYDPNNPSAGKPQDVPAGAFGTAGGILAQPKIGDVLGATEGTKSMQYDGQTSGTGSSNAKVAQAVASCNTFTNYLQPSISPSGFVSTGL